VRWVRKVAVVGYLSGTMAINGYLPFEHAVSV
jgi:hypothetical protein